MFFLFIFMTLAFSSVMNIMHAHFGRKHKMEFLLLYQGLVVLFLSTILLFFGKPISSLNNFDYIMIILSGFFSFMGLYTGIKAFKYSSVGVSRSINNVRVFIAFLFGYIIYNETLSFIQLIGGFFVLLSVILFTLSKDTRVDISLKGVGLSVLSGFFVGGTFMSIAYLTRIFGIEKSIFLFQVSTLIFTIGYILLKKIKNKELEIKITNKKVAGLLILQGIITFLNYLSYGLAASTGNLAVISIIMSSNIIIISILGYFIFSEKITKKSILYIFLCFIGLLIIGFSRL